ncbi:MAG: ADOP family duplicated permease [Gemmatimonadota bacterium]
MTPPPPRFFQLLAHLSAAPVDREPILGDLQEEFEERCDRDPADARRWYRRQVLGSLGPNLRRRARLVRNRHRGHTQGDGMMGSFWQNVRYAARAARHDIAFTSVVILTLGLGIGANSTIFSAVYGLVLHPFPFPEPDRIVGVGTAFPQLGQSLRFIEHMSPAEWEDIRDQSRTLEDVVAWDMGNRQIDTEGPPQNVFTGFWWGDALRTLGMDAHLGRGFTDEEVERGDAVALLSYRAWRDRFGADSTMVGSSLLINGNPHTLVGILPEGVLLYGMDLWTVLPARPSMWPRNRRQFQVLARIRDGVTQEEVNAELEGMARQTEIAHGGEFEEYRGWSQVAMTWNAVNSQLFRTGLFIVMGAVGFVLLLVCANTANLLLARAQKRRREMAVRTAMGAGRGRLVSQLLTESVLLSTLGGVLGVGLAILGARGVRDLLARLSLPVAGTVEVNTPVLVVTAAVAVAAGIVFGLVPAFQASATELGSTLQSEGRASTATASRQRLQRSLVALEVALAFVLLAGGAYLVNSFVRMSRVDPGFEVDNLLTMRLTLPREKYAGEAVPAFFQELTDRLRAVPGIRSAAAGTQFPTVAFSFRELWFDGREASADETLPVALATVVTPGYFETLGMRLLSGRTFETSDQAGTPRVAVLNEAAARRYLPGEDPVGRRLKIGGPDADAPWWEIVGVVASTRNRGLDENPFPEVYAVHDQVGGTQNQLFLLLRTDADPRSLLPAVRSVVTEMDADQPVYAIRTVNEAFAGAASTRRATTLLLTIFGVFALILAAVGIYSVVSFTVNERTQEIGVRIALGAEGTQVRRLVVRQALVPVLVGAVVGAGLAVPLGMGLRGLLFGIGVADPVTLASAAAVLVGAAVMASWIPARRASRMDPVEALRME